MQGTERTHKSGTRALYKQHTRQSSEVNKDSWAAEIKDKISLVDKPLQEFFKDYVPCYSEFNHSRPWTDPTEVFKEVPQSGRETEKYRYFVRSPSPPASGYPSFADTRSCGRPD